MYFLTNLFQKNSNLWDTPNLIITPHISSDSQGNYIEMVLKIFFKNLKLFIENKELINQIDRKSRLLNNNIETICLIT